MKSKNKTNGNHEALQTYFNEISHIPLLTVEEEQKLGYRALSGDEEAIKKLVESNLRFVVKIAKKYRYFGVSFLDLINQGNLGLMEAARRFDPKRNVRFISYAVWWIRQSMQVLLSEMRHPFRIPIKINTLLYKILKSHSNSIGELSEEPSHQDIAETTGLSAEAISEILKIGTEPLYLDQTYGEGKSFVEGLLPQKDTLAAETEMMRTALNKNLRDAMHQLRDKERVVLLLRFGIGTEQSLTLKEIGEKIGVSRERVRQIQEQALAKLRISPKARSSYAASFALAS